MVVWSGCAPQTFSGILPMSIAPELHAGLLGSAAVAAVVFAGIILARNPKSRPARMHAIYGGLVAWWFVCMALVATADTSGQVQLWSRLLHVAIGVLPAVVFHLNVATAGVLHKHQRSIRVHYGIGLAVVVFSLSWPDLFTSPNDYGWGPYPAYTAWGLIPVGFFVIAFVEVVSIYRQARKGADRSTAYYEKMTAFYHGNIIAALALVDFFPVFGFAVYPFGFVVLTMMHAATMFGSIRYRLIEITPEFASEQIFETLPDGVFVIDTQGLIRLTNAAGARALGRDEADLIDAPIDSVSSELGETFRIPIATPAGVREISFESADGDQRHLRVSGTLLRDQKQEPVGRVWVLHDLTEQRLAEAEKDELEGWVRHGQKLETLGVMAGGIAHDFNNLLMAILGSADLAAEKLADGAPVDLELRRIATAAERATELTSQMLTYAGEASAPEGPVDLNDLCRETAELMYAAISKKAKLDCQFGEGVPTVIADKGQMSQVLLNLITNASDALGEEVGTITLRTGVLRARSADQADSEHEARRVFLEVSDTGAGMDEKTKNRMFDPFFTTKFTGRGLGLATVAGIVRAHDGRIRVDTEPGRGTRFTIELPASTAPCPEGKRADAVSAPWEGSGVVLLADDEPAVRSVTHEMLVGAGFEVIEACDGSEAVDLFHERHDEITIVLLDITMPELDGKEAFVEIRACSPDVPIVLMSGYADDVLADPASGYRSSFLKKPFRSAGLIEKLGEAMTS